MSHDWIQVVNGKAFPFLCPTPEDIDIHVIAHGLARECRWGNQIPDLYTVAEHSVRTSLICRSEFALWGLLHDASEAYLTDVPSPIKRHLKGVHAVVERLRPILGSYVPEDITDAIVKNLLEACPDILGYYELERGIMQAVCDKFKLPHEMPEDVRVADAVMLVTERRDLCVLKTCETDPDVPPLAAHIIPWSEVDAKARFIRRFYELTRVS